MSSGGGRGTVGGPVSGPVGPGSFSFFLLFIFRQGLEGSGEMGRTRTITRNENDFLLAEGAAGEVEEEGFEGGALAREEAAGEGVGLGKGEKG